ncbi:MAG TPA: hypothetical protein VK738_18830 [Terriglobales bacterium]|jgi:hypothetical protein|nr:hypothetical protein [Terriglobales bacterium]
MDIDQLIFEIAEHKRDSDYESFFKLLKGRPFFCPVDPATIAGIPKGSSYRVQANDAIRIPFANINGVKLVPLFTFQGDKRLAKGYFEIEGLEALRMATKAPGIDGVLFQNKDNSWVGLDLKKIKWILATYGA